MNKKIRTLINSALGTFLLFGATTPEAVLAQTPLFAPTQITDNSTASDTIGNANTSRNIAVSPNGTIYVTNTHSGGIHFRRSTNRGQSFSAPLLISTSVVESEVAASSTGDVFVVWRETGTEAIKLRRSTDNGVTFGSEVTVSTVPSNSFVATNPVHMATDGANVYIVPTDGARIFRSTNSGSSFSEIALGADYVFADVLVDPISNTVVVQKDDPAVNYQVSNDFGATFGSEINGGGSVTFSVGTLARSGSSLFLISGGSGTNGIRAQVGSAGAASSFPSSAGTQGRSLSGDQYGNVVTGYVTGSDVQFSASTDAFATAFGSAIATISGTTKAEAAINSTNGDVLFLYESGGEVFLNVYDGLLIGYTLILSETNITFADQGVGTESSARSVTVTNSSNPATTLTINSITANGDFNRTTNCGSTLAPSASCTIDITFTPSALGTRTGSIEIAVAGESQNRVITLSGVGIPGPTPTPTPTSTNTPEPTSTPTVTPTPTATATPPSTGAVSQATRVCKIRNLSDYRDRNCTLPAPRVDRDAIRTNVLFRTDSIRGERDYVGIVRPIDRIGGKKTRRVKSILLRGSDERVARFRNLEAGCWAAQYEVTRPGKPTLCSKVKYFRVR